MQSYKIRLLLVFLAVVLIVTPMVWVRFAPQDIPAETPSSPETETTTSQDLANSADSVVAAPLPALSHTDFLNTSTAATYVGSRRCESCHADFTASYHETRHSRSLRSADELDDWLEARVNDPESGLMYEVLSSKSGLSHRESLTFAGASGETRTAPVKYVVGSGAFGHSFLCELDGFLVQSPVTWYSPRQEWDLSPGYDHPNHLGFRRAVSSGCLACHSGIVDEQNKNPFDVQIVEHAIGCERCHGPGSLHVDFHDSGQVLAAKDAIDHTIVNPRHLSRELEEAICQQCHLQGDATVFVRGRAADAFRPSMQLHEFRQNYQLQTHSGMTIVGHVEQMHLSACYQASESMTCVTCHDLHREFPKSELDVHYRQACLTCHQEDSCLELLAVRQETANDRCVHCHMPKTETEVPHVAFTHHRIGLHHDAAGGEESSSSGESHSTELVALLDDSHLPEADRLRCRGLGWLRIALTKSELDHDQAIAQAQDHLLAAWMGGASDAAVAAGLAQIASYRGHVDQALQWAQRALALDSTPSEERATALETLGEIQFHRGEFEESLKSFQELTQIRRNARHWFFRGLSEQNLGNTADALRSLQKSIDLNPKNPGAHSILAAIFQARGDRERQTFHSQRARVLAEQIHP